MKGIFLEHKKVVYEIRAIRGEVQEREGTATIGEDDIVIMRKFDPERQPSA